MSHYSSIRQATQSAAPKATNTNKLASLLASTPQAGSRAKIRKVAPKALRDKVFEVHGLWYYLDFESVLVME
jgi:hypothetical protein